MSTRLCVFYIAMTSAVVWAQNPTDLPPVNVAIPQQQLPTGLQPVAPPPPSLVGGNDPSAASASPTGGAQAPPLPGLIPTDAVGFDRDGGALSRFLSQKAEMNNALNNKMSGVRTATVIDEIMVDYHNAKTFAEFMRSMGIKVLPGDDVFLGHKIYAMPEILKVKMMPTLRYEGGNIEIQSGKSTLNIRPVDLDSLDFEINRHKIALPAYLNPSVRWNRLSEAMMQTQEQSWISFMPVAFAVENANTPTLSSLMAFSILSRISRSITRLSARILVDKNFYGFADVWKKSIEFKSICSGDYMERVAQKMSEISASALTCNNNAPAFELPLTEDTRRIYKIDTRKHEVEVSGAGLEKPLLYRRDYSADQNLDYINPEKPDPSELKTTQQKKDYARKIKVARMKGLKWRPIGNSSPDDLETGEHIRELATTLINGDLCRRCGLFFKHAAKVIRDETDPDTLQQMNSATSAPVAIPPSAASLNPQSPPPPMAQ